MDKMSNLLPFHKQRKQTRDRSNYFHKNASSLMKDLIATFGHRYNLPIRSFSLDELIKATNNFSEQVFADDLGAFCRGCFEGRPVLVKFCRETWCSVSYVIRDIAITSQMNHHKNVLPLIGCCLDLEIPAMVYDNALDHQFVQKLFNPLNNGNGSKPISWRSRIKIAKDVSSVLIYLHKNFPTPIIFRDLQMMSVVIDRYGVAKLVGFALSISLPPGELRVSDVVVGTFGYLDPEYLHSGFVTEKTDVYSMGLFMLALFAGRSSAFIVDDNDDEEIRSRIFIRDYVKDYCIWNSRRFNQFLDPANFEEVDRQNEDRVLEHLLALSALALRCTETEGTYRPEMIDVAKQLSQLEKSLRPY